MKAHIVVIEDDKDLSDFLNTLITSTLDAVVQVFNTGSEALKYLKNNKPNLILVDLFLNDIHGKSICEQVRKQYEDLPIIVVTGDSASESLIDVLKAGADDYITKPFNSDELIARISTKIRNFTSKSVNGQVVHGPLILDLNCIEVTLYGKQIELTSKEFELLHYLVLNKARVCMRDRILFSVWGYSADVDTRVVDVHIAKLRKKLPLKQGSIIKSIRGYGYRIADVI